MFQRKSYRVQFAGSCGFELAGIVDRPEPSPSANDRAPVVVFSHCFTCNKDLKAIVRVSRAMAERGVIVLRFDMTGLGGSGGDFSQTNFSTNLQDLAAAIQFAESELGPVTGLMGHSFGGAASLCIAGQQPPASLSSVVTLAAPSDTGHLADLLAKMDPQIESQGIGKVTIGGVSWTIRREMLADFRSHKLPDVITRINVPTLLLHSPVDKTVHYEHALRIMHLIQSNPQTDAPVSLLSLADADHLLVNEPADLEFVASAAAGFFQRY